MILFVLLLCLLSKCVKGDLPVHCLSRHVEGLWEIQKGFLKSENVKNENNTQKNVFYDFNCGYKRPDDYKYHDGLNGDAIGERFERTNIQYFLFNKDRTLQVFKNKNKPDDSYIGYWKIVYDEGVYIELYNEKKEKEIYFSFFRFRKNGNISYSYCHELNLGIVNVFSLNVDTNENSNSGTNDATNDGTNNDTNNYYSKVKDKNDMNILKMESEDNSHWPKEKLKIDIQPVKKKPIYEVLDYYNDNFINGINLLMNRYCWIGKKVEHVKNEYKKATNKIPSSIASPLIVNIEQHEKNYAYFKNKMKLRKKEYLSLNASITSVKKKEESPNVKKIKANSLFHLYIDEDISLNSFDWSNENDIKKRLGKSLKIIDKPNDQKNCGSCYANVAAVIITARVRIKYHYVKNVEYLSFSSKQFLECDYFNQGCSGGYIFLSLKYAYENFLQTVKCFEKYKSKYRNGGNNKHTYDCDRFDSFKKSMHRKEFRNTKQLTRNIKLTPTTKTAIENEQKRNKKKFNNQKELRENINATANAITNNDVGLYADLFTDQFADSYAEPRTDGMFTLLSEPLYKKKEFDVKGLNSCDVQVKVRKFEYLYLENENEEKLKNYIYHVGPVAVAVEPSREFENYKKGILSSKFIKMRDGNKLNAYIWNKVDHAVVLVGWGEDTVENFFKKNNNTSWTNLKEMYLSSSKNDLGLYYDSKLKLHLGLDLNSDSDLNSNSYADDVGFYLKYNFNMNFRAKNHLNLELEKKKIKYWKLLNSWGDMWGEKGYFYIPRGINYYNIKTYPLICDTNLFVKI